MDWSKDNSGNSTDAGVVDMTEIQNRVRFAPLSQIEGYWNALRGTRMMPQRSEIDPRGLKGALEFCFVLERIAPGLARLRVAGSHLGDLMGMEVRGMPISAFLTTDSREEFGKALEEVFETPSVATIELTAETGYGRPEMMARMVLMPVRSDLGDASRILGGFITDGEIGRSPRRFTVEKIRLAPIHGTDAPRKTEKLPLAPDAFSSKEQKFTAHPVTFGRRSSDMMDRRKSDIPFGRRAGDPEHNRRASDQQPGMAEAATTFEQPLDGVPYLRVVK